MAALTFHKLSSVFAILCLTVCITRQSVSDSDSTAHVPYNITRSRGAKNVYVPCPFAGSYAPTWKINNIYYEASSLPDGMISASYGLTIPCVNAEMDGTQFQCSVPSNSGSKIVKSAVGILTVINDSSTVPDLEASVTAENGVSQLYIDHQQFIFGEKKVSFAWKNNTESSTCEPHKYEIISTFCNESEIHTYEVDGTELQYNISNDKLTYGNNSEQVFFDLDALDSEEDICKQLLPNSIVIHESATLFDLKLPYDGICIPVLALENPNIVIPVNSSNVPDCSCPIFLKDDCKFQRCNCIHDTLFDNSLSVCDNDASDNNNFKICLRNMSVNFNTTVLYVYDSFRNCDSNNHQFRLHRVYQQSFKILLVLPNRPTLSIDSTGDLHFQSLNNHEIEVDKYKIFITDITGQLIVNKTLSNMMTSMNISNFIRQQSCSHYTVIVEAHNKYGHTERQMQYNVSGEEGDVCSCVQQNIDTTINLMNETRETKVHINCSQRRYNTSGIQIVGWAETDTGKRKNFTFMCNDSTYPLELECGMLYSLHINWTTSSLPASCLLNNKTNIHLKCPSNFDLKTLIIALPSTVGSVLVLVCCSCICLYLCRRLQTTSTTNPSNTNLLKDSETPKNEAPE